MKTFLEYFNKSNKHEGQTLIEFALVLPIFLVLVIFVMEMGFVVYTYTAVYTASREAARYAAASGFPISGTLYYQDCDGIRAKATKILAGVTVDIAYDTGHNTTKQVNLCTGSKSTVGNLALGNRVVITVSKTISLPFYAYKKNSIFFTSTKKSIQISSISYRTLIVGLDPSTTAPVKSIP